MINPDQLIQAAKLRITLIELFNNQTTPLVLTVINGFYIELLCSAISNDEYDIKKVYEMMDEACETGKKLIENVFKGKQ